MTGARILVVEDNPDNMTLIDDMLSTMDYTVLKATDGQIGLEKIASEKPDLVLMDLSLPKMDGWTVARNVKDNPDLRSIPIIAITAHAMVGDRERALEAGCDDYITKPIRLMELQSKLSEYLDK